MRIAIPVESGSIFDHFGQTAMFRIYEVDGKSVLSHEDVPTNGIAHRALVSFLKERNVTVLICGNLGPGGREACQEQQIAFFPGVSGTADQAAADFANGCLKFDMAASACGCHCHH